MNPPAQHEGSMPRREVGHLAVWSVTSAKPGNGVEMLRDGSGDTFWQSDGLQPHLINIQFQRKMPLLELHMHVDYKLDESYTPSKISVRAGHTYQDLKEVRVVDLEEPSGWIVVPLTVDGAPHEPLKAFYLQLAVLTNHQNGRDTHIRQVKVWSARSTEPTKALPCTMTPHMALYSTVR
ncbi:Anaphase-promoting complex subunit 10 [Tetrabaena socialis]|uniref:Anaphase-promoting complex subunit 10 n=1 Tax=Tetrabaena socialis TaxID=47790 RepID=A0A2J8AC12_9CHLO|nr:Anaphase-promoting complex subunit 10 [Tetrabaena socialis]|eukprot:PNH10062.1 Anaphase-promoting complex subunit 10 [Tetrabaena socialis]